jgi:hypothetical protein
MAEENLFVDCMEQVPIDRKSRDKKRIAAFLHGVFKEFIQEKQLTAWFIMFYTYKFAITDRRQISIKKEEERKGKEGKDGDNNNNNEQEGKEEEKEDVEMKEIEGSGGDEEKKKQKNKNKKQKKQQKQEKKQVAEMKNARRLTLKHILTQIFDTFHFADTPNPDGLCRFLDSLPSDMSDYILKVLRTSNMISPPLVARMYSARFKPPSDLQTYIANSIRKKKGALGVENTLRMSYFDLLNRVTAYDGRPHRCIDNKVSIQKYYAKHSTNSVVKLLDETDVRVLRLPEGADISLCIIDFNTFPASVYTSFGDDIPADIEIPQLKEPLVVEMCIHDRNMYIVDVLRYGQMDCTSLTFHERYNLARKLVTENGLLPHLTIGEFFTPSEEFEEITIPAYFKRGKFNNYENIVYTKIED